MRVRKTVNGVATNYTYNGKMLAHMTKGTDSMHFFYDAQGRPAMVNYNGNNFHYIHNLQGDIVAIVDSNDNKVVEYYYDAWGRFAAGVYATGYLDLLQLNPFRYRGYVYDSETGLCYLQSRYYSCVLGRFISADNRVGRYGMLNDHNLYAYCKNSPITLCDFSGYDADLAIYLWGLLPFMDGPLPVGDIISLIGLGVLLYISPIELSNTRIKDTPDIQVIPNLVKNIDWDKAKSQRNHILHGSKQHGGHNWSPFGIGPNDPDGWTKLLPFLKAVAEKGRIWANPNETKKIDNVVYYIYEFDEYAKSIVLKLYDNGSEYLVSDAYPYP